MLQLPLGSMCPVALSAYLHNVAGPIPVLMTAPPAHPAQACMSSAFALALLSAVACANVQLAPSVMTRAIMPQAPCG